MHRRKCDHCGLVSSPSEVKCKRCGTIINEYYKLDLAQPRIKRKIRLPFLSMFLLTVVGGGGYAVWSFDLIPAEPVAQMPANANVAQKGILYEAIAQANGQQPAPGTGIKTNFENSKAITEARNRSLEADKLAGVGTNTK